jgi:hypothetical protein
MGFYILKHWGAHGKIDDAYGGSYFVRLLDEFLDMGEEREGVIV